MIICGYAGIGKSYLAHNYPNIIDLESTPFEKDWDRYFKCAKHYSNQGFLVLLSCHKEIRERVLSIPYEERITIFPCIGDKELFRKRYKQRGNSEEFIKLQMDNWEKWTSENNRLLTEHLEYMESGETLYDTIIRLKNQDKQKFDNFYCQENYIGFQETGKCFADGDCKAKREAEIIDKIEPKFHEGDWTVSKLDKKARQVSEVHFDEYNSYYVVNGKSVNLEEYDRLHHLWDISNARDGDVLCCKSGWTCIFKALNNHTNTFSSYCFMDSDKWFCNTGSEYHTLDERFLKAYNFELYPATKEQRELLFQKMKEAGYTFDFEKKELKKIEQS